MADNDEDYQYIKDMIADAKDTRYGQELVGKNANDLHILVAVQSDPRPISAWSEYPEFEALLNEQDADGMTPLMYAAQDLKGDIILLLAGTQPALENKRKKTALQLFDEALVFDAEQEYPEFPKNAPEYTAQVRRVLGAPAGGRRRKTRMRKTKRRLTRRRK